MPVTSVHQTNSSSSPHSSAERNDDGEVADYGALTDPERHNNSSNDNDDYHPHDASIISDTVNPAVGGPWPWLEAVFRVRRNNDSDNTMNGGASSKEQIAATAQNMDACAKGVLHSASAFLGPALIHCASVVAADHHNQDGTSSSSADQAVNLLIGGTGIFAKLRPSSILTVSSIVSTITAALLLPMVGAIVDRTPHRKRVGAWTAYGLIIINGLQIFVSQSNWQWFVFTYTINDCINIVHHAIILAYLQNLTLESTTLTQYTSKFALVQFAAMIGYMLFMVLYSKLVLAKQNADNDNATPPELTANAVAHLVSTTFGAVVLTYAWRYLFVATPPRHYLQTGHSQPNRDNSNNNDPLLLDTTTTTTSSHTGGSAAATPSMVELWTSSWKGLWDTLQKISRDYSSLKWLLFTLLWSPSVGSGSYFSIFSTLHKSLLQMTSAQIGLVNLATLICTLPGAKLASFLTSGGPKWNPLQSFQACLTVLAINNALTALLVKGPEQLPLYLLFQCILGMCFGWLLPTERVLFCTLTPLGQEAELMSLVLSVHTCAAWIPPFLFSALNEAGYSLRLALAAQDVLLITALLATLGVGSFEHAVAQVRGGGGGGENASGRSLMGGGGCGGEKCSRIQFLGCRTTPLRVASSIAVSGLFCAILFLLTAPSASATVPQPTGSSSTFRDWFTARCGPDGESAWLYQGGLFDPLTGEQLAHVEGLEIVQGVSYRSNKNKPPQEEGAKGDGHGDEKALKLLSVDRALSHPKAQYEQSATLLSRKIFIYRQVQDKTKLLDKVKLRPYSPEKSIPVEQAVSAYATANTFVERVPGREWMVVGEWPNGQTVWNQALVRQQNTEATQPGAASKRDQESNSLEFTVHVRPRPAGSKRNVPDLTIEPQTVRDDEASKNSTGAATRSPPRASLFSMGPSTAEKMGTGARETYQFEWSAAATTKQKGPRLGFGRRKKEQVTESDCTVQYTRYGEGPVWYGPSRFCTLELRGKRWPTESRPLPEHIAAWCERHGWTLPRHAGLTEPAAESTEEKIRSFRKEKFLDLDKIYGRADGELSATKWKNQRLASAYGWARKWSGKLRQAATLEMTGTGQ